MASRKTKTLVFALVFFAAMLGLGLASVKSANYKDVSALKMYAEPTRNLEVKGAPELFQPGHYVVKIGDTVLEFAVRSPSPYAVAKRVSGPPLSNNDDEYAVFLLKSSSGDYRVLAVFSAKTFVKFYGPNAVMDISNVVVSGTYRPDLRAHIYVYGGRGLVDTTPGGVPVFIVSRILEGCHQSYGQPSGRIA